MASTIPDRHNTAADLTEFRNRYTTPRPTGRSRPAPQPAGSELVGLPSLLIVAALVIGSLLLSHQEPAATTPYAVADGATPVGERSTQLSAAPTREAAPDLPEAAPIAAPDYPWLSEGSGGEPVTWPCGSIGYRVVREGAPAGVDQLVADATARISAVSGHQFHADPPLQRLNERNSPYVGITIAWVPRATHPEASQDAIGTTSATATSARSGSSQYSAASVDLLADWLGADRADFSVDGVGPVLLHELGHALGLGHIDDPTAMMYPTNLGVATWSEREQMALRYLRLSCRER